MSGSRSRQKQRPLLRPGENQDSVGLLEGVSKGRCSGERGLGIRLRVTSRAPGMIAMVCLSSCPSGSFDRANSALESSLLASCSVCASATMLIAAKRMYDNVFRTTLRFIRIGFFWIYLSNHSQRLLARQRRVPGIGSPVASRWVIPDAGRKNPRLTQTPRADAPPEEHHLPANG